MSTPFKEIPSQIKDYVSEFRRFFTKPQFKHFITLITGITINENKTLQEINDSLSKQDQSSLNRFVTRSKWDLNAVNIARIQLAKKSTTLGKYGMQIIDSTLAHKTGKHMEKANYHMSGITKEVHWGHCIVDSIYVDELDNMIPIDARIYVREEDGDEETPFKTKREIGLEEVDFGLAQGLPITIVAADSDYYSASVVSELKKKRLKHLLGVKNTLKISVQREKRISIIEYIASLPETDFSTHTINGSTFFLHAQPIYIRGIGKERLVISYKDGEKDNIKTYLTDLMEESEEKLMRFLLQRWKIETWHRDAKQHLGLEDYQLRKYRGIQVVVLAVLVADTLLALGKNQALLMPLKRSLETVGEGCRYLRLIAMKGRAWLKRAAEDIQTLKEVLNRYVFVKNAKV